MTLNPEQARIAEFARDLAARARGGASLALKAPEGFYSIVGQDTVGNPDLMGLSVARAGKAWNPNWDGINGSRVGRLIEYGPNQVRSGAHGVVKETAAATNLFRNPLMEGAEPGFLNAGGKLPLTGFGGDRFEVSGATAAQVQVIGYVLRDGWRYLRLRFVGSINATVLIISPGGAQNPAASPGQHALACNVAHSGGTLNNIGTVVTRVNFEDSNNSFVNSLTTSTTPDAFGRRWTNSGAAGAGTAFARIQLIRFAATGAVDVTFDIAGFQLEAGTASTSPVFPEPNDPGPSTREAETFTYGATETVRASRETYINEDGSITRFLNNTIAYGSRGLQIFEGSTNLTTQSENIASEDSTGVTYSLNSMIAPDGEFTADRLLETTSDGSHHTRRVFTNSTVRTLTISTFFRSIGGRNGRVRIEDATDLSNRSDVTIDLRTGALLENNTNIGAYANGAVRIERVGLFWWRVGVTVTVTAQDVRIRRFATSGDSAFYPGDVTKGIAVWGLQVEEFPIMTPYIPTGTATVARATPLHEIALGEWFNPDQGTIFVEAVYPQNLTVNPSNSRRPLLTITPGPDLRGAHIATQPFLGNIEIRMRDDSIQSNATFGSDLTGGQIIRAALTYGASGARASANGQSESIARAMFTAIALRVGTGAIVGPSAANQRANTLIRDAGFIPRELSQSEIENLTAL